MEHRHPILRLQPRPQLHLTVPHQLLLRPPQQQQLVQQLQHRLLAPLLHLVVLQQRLLQLQQLLQSQ
jgi:hypothetical protein